MKYLLINQQTGEETLCDKVTVDGFDYYARREEIRLNDPITDGYRVWFWEDNCSLLGRQKVIATNNHYLDIPQVVDEDNAIRLAFKHIACTKDSQFDSGVFHGFVGGYHKSQETHPFSCEDADAYADAVMGGCLLRAKEWKSQQPKKIYYKKTTQP